MSSVYGQTLLDDMVQYQGLPMPLVRQAAKEILEVIRGGLVRDGVVNVSNFGTFRLKPVAARNGFNPQTREPITIPAHQRVIFSPCKALRELIQPEHLPPIPLAEAQQAPRAAARSAPITASEAVATRTIVPQPVEETTDRVGAVSSMEQSPDKEGESTQSLKEVTTAQIDEHIVPPPTGEELADRDESVAGEEIEIPLEEEDKDTLSSLREEKLLQEERARADSRKHYYLGAAAILVIAIVSMSLLNRGNDIAPVAPVTPKVASIAPLPPAKPVADAPATESEPAPTQQDISEGPEASSPATEATPEFEEKPDTAAHDMQPVVAETTTTPLPDAATDSIASDETATVHATEEAAVESARPSHFFFTEQVHTITSGESLWRLARRYYQDPLLWPHIYQANAAIIDDPDSLRTGESITLPSLQGTPTKLTRTDRRNIAEGYYLIYLHYKESGHKDAFFALLEAKRYDNNVVEEHRSLLSLSRVEEILLGQQETMPF